MPGKTFDSTMLQTKLKEYITELSDLATTGENVQEYTDYCAAIFAIKAMTDFFYTPDSKGAFPVMDQGQKLEMMSLYKKAIDASVPLLTVDEDSLVGAQMSMIVREILPLLHSDHMALEMADVKKSMPLPEIIDMGRTQVVDISDQPLKTESGASNTRQKIRIENGKDVVEGYFTPTQTVNSEKDYKAFLDEMEKKYDPVFKPFIDRFRRYNTEDVYNEYAIPYGVEILDNEEIKNARPKNKKNVAANAFVTNLWSGVKIKEDDIEKAFDNPDFLKFSNEFFDKLKKLHADYFNYKGENSFLNIEDGANIDRRNLAMYRMAGLLGKPGLVAETRPMIVIQNGEPVVGTFMAEAHGVDVNKLTSNSPILNYEPEAFDNPAVFDDIAAMQVLDYLCGNVDRHPGNFFLRFEPEDAENAKLVGITLIDNDMSWGDADEEKKGLPSFVKLNHMGVIGEDCYNAIRAMTREQMEIMLAGCKLSQKEIDKAWERRNALLKKVEEDAKYFADKEVGYTEEKRIRIVKQEEWASYSMSKLAETHENSKFFVIHNGAELAKLNLNNNTAENMRKEGLKTIKVELGLTAPGPKAEVKTPVGKIIGNGIFQRVQNPDNALEEDVTKLAIPSMTHVPRMGNILSSRYLLSYEEDGETREVFFTPEQDSGVRAAYTNVFKSFIDSNPKYEEELIKLRDYYSTDDIGSVFLPGKFDNIPWKDMVISGDRITQLKEDDAFKNMLSNLAGSVSSLAMRNIMLTSYGLNLGEGKRIEVRNVAMSDVSDIIGADDILARSKMTQVMCDGRVINGVIMDKADGVDINNIPGNHPMSQIPEGKIDDVYNTAEGLRSIADLQILDYICLNVDRHSKNVMYRFKDLGTDHPKFLGVFGIDNDASFGDMIPKPGAGTDHLCPLNSMQVISEKMARAIRDPKTVENIMEKLGTRKLSESEINAVKARIDQIKAAIDDGRIRVVKNDEWAKGENTFQKLSEDKNSFFSVMHNAIEDVCKKGKEYKAEHNGIVEPYTEKKLSFAKCQKVDSFGGLAVENKDMDELERKATKEFLENIRTKAEEAPADSAASERDFVSLIHREAAEMLSVFEQADPAFSFTSSTYKEVKTACSELVKLSDKLSKKMRNPEDILSAKDTNKLNRYINRLSDKCAAYKSKKVREVEQGRALGKNAPARMEACDNGAMKAETLRKNYRATIVSQEAAKNPIFTASRLLKKAQMDMSGLTGEKLRSKVAEVIYYKGLTRMDIESKKTPALKNAVQPQVMTVQRDQILASPAFKVLSDMPDNELRSLAARTGGEKLLKSFIRETAKNMKQSKSKQNPVVTKLQNTYKDNQLVK